MATTALIPRFTLNLKSFSDQFMQKSSIQTIEEGASVIQVQKPFDYDIIQKYMDENPGRKFIENEPRQTQPIDMDSYYRMNEDHFNDKKKEYMRLLDEKSQMIPEEINGIHTKLPAFERTAVAALVEVEEKRCAYFQDPDKNLQGIVNISAGVYSDELGAGKTISMLTLIRIKPQPLKYHQGQMINHCFDLRPIYLDPVKEQNKKSEDTGFRGFIRRAYKIVLRPTVVFAGVSVAKQWVD